MTVPPATDSQDFSNGYPISERYRDTFDSIVSRWRVTPLPAFDIDEQLIRVRDLEVSLRGSLVLVHFELRHYGIKDKRTNIVVTNTFSAMATQVVVLEPAPIKTPSQYRNLLMKGPKRLPQSPTKIGDQKNAVEAFHPGDIFVSNGLEMRLNIYFIFFSCGRYKESGPKECRRGV
jgi:hypothetical protein